MNQISFLQGQENRKLMNSTHATIYELVKPKMNNFLPSVTVTNFFAMNSYLP